MNDRPSSAADDRRRRVRRALQAADPAAGSEPDLPALYAAVTEATGVTVAGAPRRRAGGPPQPVVHRAGSGRGRRRRGRGDRRRQLRVGLAPTLRDAADRRAGDHARRQAPPAPRSTPRPRPRRRWPRGERGLREADVPLVRRPDGVHRRRAVHRGRLAAARGGSTRRARTREETVVARGGGARRRRASRGSSTAPGRSGPNDGSGPSVSLSADGLASLSYYDPTRDPWNCAGLRAGPRRAAGRRCRRRRGRAARAGDRRRAVQVPDPRDRADGRRRGAAGEGRARLAGHRHRRLRVRGARPTRPARRSPTSPPASRSTGS